MKTTLAAVIFLSTCFAALLWMSASGNPPKHTVIAVSDSVEVAAIDWEKMDHSERMAYMKKHVNPAMRAEFQNFDAKRYAKFGCKTCHGKGAEDDSYKMPNPDLPKLPRSKEGWDKIKAEKGEMLKFMGSTVKPKMASLLCMKEFDMKTKTGFGCGNCHTEEKPSKP